jgi:DNA-directed RNA polymerase specialized sigma24 family protein
VPDTQEDFEQFFRREFGALVSFVRKLGCGIDDARDAAIDAMHDAYRHWSRVSRPLVWIRLAAGRVAAHKGRHPIADQSEETDGKLRLLTALATLPEDHLVVIGWHLEGFTTDEIAQAQGISEATVRSTSRHALNLLGRDDTWLYEANRDLDDATAAEVDVDAALAQIQRRSVEQTGEFEIPVGEPLFSAPVVEVAESSGTMVRPYTMTRGRTRSDYDFAIEALVFLSEKGRELGERIPPEHRTICRLCLEATSVAEIAAALDAPMGSVRVLVGDLVGMGLVVVYNPPAGGPSFELLKRVRDGLINLD